MKIAVIGAGVSGLVAARRLTRQGHDVSVFEAGDRWGGHAQAVSLEASDPVEVGFLVFNQAACPYLTRLLAELNVPTREFRTAYEVRHPESELVLRGGSLRDLLSVPSNLAVPAFYRVVPDWMRFSRQARRLLRRGQFVTATLGEFLKDGRYSAAFAEQFAYPLAGAVYPLRGESLAETPLASLLGFLHNHALLKLTRGNSCRTVIGGSQGYLRRLTDEFRSRIHLNCPVAAIARNDNYVLLKFPHRSRERFDRVVLAIHADAALRLLADPTRHEREVLDCFDYAPQNVYLHDEAVRQGPSSHASAIWRFQPAAGGQAGASLSYRVAQLQGVDAPHSLMLTAVGADQPPPPHVLRTIRFRRPVFSAESLLAQRRFRLINGRRRTFFCGSYRGHGFHEDAVRSAEEVADMLSPAPAEPLTV